MNNIIQVLKNAPDYIGGSGVKCDEIKNAEDKLCTRFADDYMLYLQEIGLACYDGHELTGLSGQQRLNVVDVTIERRKSVSGVSRLYVIEETNFDGIIIWQSTSGDIYMTAPNSTPQKICNSLIEYILNE